MMTAHTRGPQVACSTHEHPNMREHTNLQSMLTCDNNIKPDTLKDVDNSHLVEGPSVQCKGDTSPQPPREASACGPDNQYIFDKIEPIPPAGKNPYSMVSEHEIDVYSIVCPGIIGLTGARGSLFPQRIVFGDTRTYIYICTYMYINVIITINAACLNCRLAPAFLLGAAECCHTIDK